MKSLSLIKAFGLASFLAAYAASSAAFAQEVTLRMHQFLPAQANVPAQILYPWADKIEAESGGRIKIERFDSMALGGTPPQLIDQARDGVVDIIWTLPGYTPGRFPRVEVFELPFMMTNGEATSKAYWQLMVEEIQATDFKDVKILGAWVHGPGVIHSKAPITSLADMASKKLRGPTRVINALLQEAGATPVGMPVPAIPESLSKGVIDGAVIPWEVSTSLKVQELVSAHTEFAGDKALYTATFVLAMNKAKFDSLPDDLKKIIENNSGAEFSANAGKVQQLADGPARQIAVDRGNTISQIDEAALQEWYAVADKVAESWKAEMAEKGIDGEALITRAKALIAENTK